MSSRVNVETVKLTAGINLPNTVIVQGGADGAFFPANQIGWGNSTFMNSEFGGTTEGLLNKIENVIVEDEHVIAGALNDLNKRTLNTITSYTTADASLSTRIDVIENAGYATMKDVENFVSTNTPDIDIPTKISELENDKGYLVKVVLTQQEYDALEEKDVNTLYVISDANEVEDNNFVTESQLESRGFLTQTDKSELNEYDQFLLSKIDNIDLSNYLTLDENRKNELVISTALNDLSDRIDNIKDNIDLSNYLTIEENEKNELVISTALNDLLSKITSLESQLSTAMTKISVLEQELAKTLVID